MQKPPCEFTLLTSCWHHSLCFDGRSSPSPSSRGNGTHGQPEAPEEALVPQSSEPPPAADSQAGKPTAVSSQTPTWDVPCFSAPSVVSFGFLFFACSLAMAVNEEVTGAPGGAPQHVGGAWPCSPGPLVGTRPGDAIVTPTHVRCQRQCNRVDRSSGCRALPTS